MLRTLYRSVWLPAAITTILLLLALVLLFVISWRSLTRLEPVHSHLAGITRLQEAGREVREILIRSLSTQTEVDPARRAAVREKLQAIMEMDDYLAPQTREGLARADAILGDAERASIPALEDALSQLRQVTAVELRAHDNLLLAVKRDSRAEFEIAAAAVFGFPLLALLTLYLLRRRILLPLRNLGILMASLAQQGYTPVPVKDADPLLVPLFEHYNSMVSRLAELERQHRSRQHSLENAVRAATRSLLEHQRELANAERLAAVGEVAASVAHELRNPLAGIQMALGNLRSDLDKREHAERLDMAIVELKRVTRLLNDLLSQPRQAPEPAVDLGLADSVGTLFDLVRYQIHDGIRLRQDIAPELGCRLPEGRLRQALLNLILNAVQNLDEGPGTITVSAELKGSLLIVRVEDDGPGFPPELLQSGVRAFAAWRRGGTGLGLAMVRRFAQDLGGRLRLANRTPNGASVTLELPCG